MRYINKVMYYYVRS